MTRLTHILVRSALAALASLFVFACMNGGVSVHGWLGALQVGVVCGIVVAALAPNAWAALVSGAVVGFVGGFAFIAWFIGGDLGVSGLLVGVTSVSAGLGRVLLERTPVTSDALALAGVALVVVGMWSVVAGDVSKPAFGGALTALQKLQEQPKPGALWSDGTMFRAIVVKMRGGMPYYEAFRWGYDNNGYTMKDPTNVVQVRMPALFYVWTVLPGWPASLVWSLLALASVACVACIGVAREIVDPTLGLGGAAALGAYAIAVAESPQNVTNFELWSGLLAVAVLYAYLKSVHSPRGAAWTIAAAGVAVMAFAIRELMIFLPVIGMVGTLVVPKERRRFEVTVWSAAFAACIALWAAHLWAASHITTTLASGVASTWLGGGGVDFLVRGISTYNVFFAAPWVPFALAVLGVFGALSLPSVQARVFAALAGVAPVVSFLFIGNASLARNLATDVPVNYWGAIAMPMLIALAPAAFALLPGLRSSSLRAATLSERLPEPTTSLQ